MNVESRDSVSLKPAELDEFGQLLHGSGLPVSDAELDHQVEQFPLVVLAYRDDELQGVMLGSLERIGGTPSILWGAGVARKNKDAATTLRLMTSELSRRAAISFPDEDVVVAARVHRPSVYTLLQTYANVVPRPGYTPNGEDRAWGRRLAKRFGVERPLRRQDVPRRGQGSQAPVRAGARRQRDQGDRWREDRLARRRARRAQGSGDHRVRLGRRRRPRVRHLRRRILTDAPTS